MDTITHRLTDAEAFAWTADPGFREVLRARLVERLGRVRVEVLSPEAEVWAVWDEQRRAA
jgi:hypothetical protein